MLKYFNLLMKRFLHFNWDKDVKIGIKMRKLNFTYFINKYLLSRITFSEQEEKFLQKLVEETILEDDSADQMYVDEEDDGEEDHVEEDDSVKTKYL